MFNRRSLIASYFRSGKTRLNQVPCLFEPLVEIVGSGLEDSESMLPRLVDDCLHVVNAGAHIAAGWLTLLGNWAMRNNYRKKSYLLTLNVVGQFLKSLALNPSQTFSMIPRMRSPRWNTMNTDLFTRSPWNWSKIDLDKMIVVGEG